MVEMVEDNTKVKKKHSRLNSEKEPPDFANTQKHIEYNTNGSGIKIAPIIRDPTANFLDYSNKFLVPPPHRLPQTNPNSLTKRITFKLQPGDESDQDILGADEAQLKENVEEEEDKDNDSDDSLTESEKKKLEKILATLKGAVNFDQEKKDEMQAEIDEEKIDPNPDLIEGIFEVDQNYHFVWCCKRKTTSETSDHKIFVYDYRSFYCLHFKNPMRIQLVNFTCSSMFENFIILLIFLNSIILAVYDYNDRDNKLDYNKLLERIGQVFTILFSVEMTLKILAQGFILHYNAYLRDAWNWLDFVVVITGIMEMMELSWFKVRALRTLRVLRPLRSIKAFPKMRKLVSSLIGSVSSLFNAVVFMLFIFMLFGILGIQQFQGTMYNRCRFTEEPLPDGTWPFDETLDYLCSPDGQGLMECPADRFCKQPVDAGLSAMIDMPINQERIFYNLIGFDNLGWAMLTIFQMITLEQWTTVMYLLMDSNIWWMGVIFSVALVIIGSFFLLNVILAVLADALNMVEQVQNRQDNARLAKIRQSLNRAEAQRQKSKQDQGDTKSEDQSQHLSSCNVEQESQVRELLSRDHQKEDVNVELVDLKDPRNSVTADQRANQSNQIGAGANENQKQNLPQPRGHLAELRLQKSEAKPNTKQLQVLSQGQNSENHSELAKVQNSEFSDKHAFDSQNSKMFMSNDLEGAHSPSKISRLSSVMLIPDRSEKNKIYHICYLICTHWSFTMLITILIIANTAVLALEKFPEDPKTNEISATLNDVFTWAFVAEMVIKLIGLGFKEYARDSFNLFDAFIVVLSIVDMIVSAALAGDGESPTGALSAFRGVRLLRVFKLARSWSSFREILAKILITVKDVSTFSLLLVMFMFIFSLLGMELFGYKVLFFDDLFQSPHDKDFHKAQAPRPNFNDLGMSITSIFAVAIGDDWNYFMAMAFRSEGFIAIIFYPVVFTFMNLILLNLFLAILLQNFENREQQNEVNHEKAEGKTFYKLARWLKRCCKPCNERCSRLCSCCILQNEDVEDELVDGSSMQESDISYSDEANDEKKAHDNIIDVNVQKCDGGKEVSNIMVQKISSDSIGESLIEEQASDREGSSFMVGEGIARRSSTEHFDNNKSMLGLNDMHTNQQADQRSGCDVSRPGNQQDGEVPSILEDVRDKKSNDDSTLNGLHRMKALKFKEQKVGNNKQFIRQDTQIQSMHISRVTQNIPKEYNTDALRKLQRKPRRQMTGYEKKRMQDLEMTQNMLQNSNKNMSMAQMKKMELIESLGGDQKNIKIIGRSLLLFGNKNCLRNICYHIVKHKYYDSVVLVLIGISTFLLTLDNPNIDPMGNLANVLRIFDVSLTTLFTMECLINMILFGFLCNGQSSYAKDPWNVMDLFIVIFSILTLVLSGLGNGQLSILKLFRMLRVLRPLRFLKRNLGLKIQVISLMNAIPGIGNLLLISMLILMIFGIQAVGLLKGTFYYCDTENIPEYAHDEIQTKWDCLDYGADWVNLEGNFDNVANAMVTMFGMMSTEGWLEVMWSAVDSTEIYQIPKRDNKLPFIIFFSVFMVVGSLFILNLFVGVVINTFNIEKEKLSRNNLLTELQNEYCEVLIKCYGCKPTTAVIETGNKFRNQMMRLTKLPAFDIIIFVCICLNTVVLAMSWYGMAQEIIDVLEILNYIFTVIYTIEMFIKIIALGKGYFKDGWCLFDFVIVLSAWIGILLFAVFKIDVGSISTIIRSFRIARVLKLIKTAKNLQQIFQTFILAIPELMNVGALLILFLFLFSVLGVSLFAEVKLQDTMDRHANFENFGRAILTLLRVATGEGWVGIMQDAARHPSIHFECIFNQTYEQKEKDGIQGCGSSAGYFYFVAFILMVSLVFLNLFIAIILEGFAASSQESKIRVGDECFEAFQRAWSKYDPLSTEMIAIENLENLIMDLIVEELEIINKGSGVKDVNFNLHKFRVLGFYSKWKKGICDDEDREGYFKDIAKNKRRQRGMRREMRRFIRLLYIPLYDNMQKVQFHDTLNGIIDSVYKRLHEKFVFDRNQRIETKLEVGEPLNAMESMKVGDMAFWDLHFTSQEEFLQMIENDFQKVVNRLENKGHRAGQAILKLDFMRRLRVTAGAKYSKKLSMYNEPKVNYQRIFDSSHFIGARIIETHMLKRRRFKNNPQLAAQKLRSSIQAFDEGTLQPKLQPDQLEQISNDSEEILDSSLKGLLPDNSEILVIDQLVTEPYLNIIDGNRLNSIDQLHQKPVTMVQAAQMAADVSEASRIQTDQGDAKEKTNIDRELSQTATFKGVNRYENAQKASILEQMINEELSKPNIQQDLNNRNELTPRQISKQKDSKKKRPTPELKQSLLHSGEVELPVQTDKDQMIITQELIREVMSDDEGIILGIDNEITERNHSDDSREYKNLVKNSHLNKPMAQSQRTCNQVSFKEHDRFNKNHITIGQESTQREKHSLPLQAKPLVQTSAKEQSPMSLPRNLTARDKQLQLTHASQALLESGNSMEQKSQAIVNRSLTLYQQQRSLQNLVSRRSSEQSYDKKLDGPSIKPNTSQKTFIKSGEQLVKSSPHQQVSASSLKMIQKHKPNVIRHQMLSNLELQGHQTMEHQSPELCRNKFQIKNQPRSSMMNNTPQLLNQAYKPDQYSKSNTMNTPLKSHGACIPPSTLNRTSFQNKFYKSNTKMNNKTQKNFHIGIQLRKEFTPVNNQQVLSDAKKNYSKSQTRPQISDMNYTDQSMIVFQEKTTHTLKKRKQASQKSGPKHNMVWFQAGQEDDNDVHGSDRKHNSPEELKKRDRIIKNEISRASVRSDQGAVVDTTVQNYNNRTRSGFNQKSGSMMPMRSSYEEKINKYLFVSIQQPASDFMLIGNELKISSPSNQRSPQQQMNKTQNALINQLRLKKNLQQVLNSTSYSNMSAIAGPRQAFAEVGSISAQLGPEPLPSATKLALREPMGHSLNIQPQKMGIQELREQLQAQREPSKEHMHTTMAEHERQLRQLHSNQWNYDRNSLIQAKAGRHELNSNIKPYRAASKSNNRQSLQKKKQKILDAYTLI